MYIKMNGKKHQLRPNIPECASGLMENPFGPIVSHGRYSLSQDWLDLVVFCSKMAAGTPRYIKMDGKKHQLRPNIPVWASGLMENPFGPIVRHGLLSKILDC